MTRFRDFPGSLARKFLASFLRGYRGRDFARTKAQLQFAVFEIDGAGTFRFLPDRAARRDVQIALIAAGTDKAFMDAIASARNPHEAVHEAMVVSGRLFELLGQCLVPEGAQWTPRLAHETAEKLARVSSPAGQRMMRNIAIAIFNWSLWITLGAGAPQSKE